MHETIVVLMAEVMILDFLVQGANLRRRRGRPRFGPGARRPQAGGSSGGGG